MASQAGCAYRVAVSGIYADPKTSNNVATITNHDQPCNGSGSTGTAASSTPKSPAAAASTIKPSANSVASGPASSTEPLASTGPAGSTLPVAATPPTLTLTAVHTAGHGAMMAYGIVVLALLAGGGFLVLRSRRS